MNRPRPRPLTPTRILVRPRPTRVGRPADWSASVRYIGIDGRWRVVSIACLDLDDAVDDLLDRLEDLGIGDAVLDRLPDTVEVRS
ncbi:hypothetical protein IU500_13385 [Nocardia terpenica]|uniref:hypothetical protein n=1 Tax=Nocardia terpenica TaxID=455432 RepID=UPI001894543B|nr:hypothetical protein [Nocardia terpenica]MBF6062830.1 hypothetical protein [Nocardia terpenica]MBF6105035.1 hypothetical protein [Nocardia terpenica]MBF6112528.1 hypothetical protein [Nocardia terpenica]MBF6118763.1 hypothetical protein [Nocardia terpenica]MBF6154232.1 hypothetical protein [Nocardia terpenica]